MNVRRAGVLSWTMCLCFGCGNASRPDARYVSIDDAQGLADARTKLSDLRARLVPSGDVGYQITAVLKEGRSGKTISSRGAVAVRAPGDVRMQLVGPAGALALDVWIHGDEARLAVPALDHVERISGDAPEPGRPVAFLRWWMLHPLDGEMLHAFRDREGGARYLLRTSDGAEIDARIDRTETTFDLTRRSSRDEEHLSATSPPCGTARYESREAHLTVDVTCDGPTPKPSPRAFEDPDAQGPKVTP